MRPAQFFPRHQGTLPQFSSRKRYQPMKQSSQLLMIDHERPDPKGLVYTFVRITYRNLSQRFFLRIFSHSLMYIVDQTVELLDGHPYLRGLANRSKSNKSYPREHPASLWFTNPIWLIAGVAGSGKRSLLGGTMRWVQSVLTYRLPGLCLELIFVISLTSCLSHSTNATSLGLRFHHPGQAWERLLIPYTPVFLLETLSVRKFCDSLLFQLPLDPSCLHQVSLWLFHKVWVQFLKWHAVGYMSNICQLPWH